MNWKLIILLLSGYTFVYAGISKYAPQWTGGKPHSLWDATGFGVYFKSPSSSQITLTARISNDQGVTTGGAPSGGTPA